MAEKFINQYLAVCDDQRNLSKKTVKAYKIDLQQFIAFQDKTFICSKKVVLEYIELLNRNYKPRTVKRKIASLRAFFQFLKDEQLINENPFSSIKLRMRAPKTLPRVIPTPIIEKMLRIAHQDVADLRKSPKISTQNALILELLFSTGIRVGELCRLSKSDIDIEGGSLRIMGKGAKERILQIGTPSVLNLLRIHYRQCPPDSQNLLVNRMGKPLSEQSVRTIVKKYATRAGAPMHITPLMFRHSFATALLDANVDIRYIQKLLGHSSIMTTQIYTEVSTAKQREVLTNCHPRNQMDL